LCLIAGRLGRLTGVKFSEVFRIDDGKVRQ
jgi:hypothetical protein